MKYFFLIICSILLPVLSLKKAIPKLCINCKFVMADERYENKYSKCSLFPIDNSKENSVQFLVSGVEEETETDYYNCSVARSYEHLCGTEGKKYKKKQTKTRN